MILRDNTEQRGKVSDRLADDMVHALGPIVTDNKNYNKICENPVTVKLGNGLKMEFEHIGNYKVGISLQLDKDIVSATYDLNISPQDNFKRISESINRSNLNIQSLMSLDKNLVHQSDEISL